MKRWNQKGSIHARRRMAELRARKERLATMTLSRQYREHFGLAGEAFVSALKAGNFPWGQPESAKQKWFRAAISAQPTEHQWGKEVINEKTVSPAVPGD